MSEKRRHAAVLVLAAGLLAALYVTRPEMHAGLGIAMLGLAAVLDPKVAKRSGRPLRWLGTAIVLAAVGLWLGPGDMRVRGHAISLAGALAATTMVSRAIGLVMLGSAAGALYPAERALARLRRTRFRRFAEVLVVALELVPSLLGALETARRESAARRPGLRGFPGRILETFVFAVEHASALADSVAQRLAESAPQGGPSSLTESAEQGGVSS
ncbi:MAG: hypothetical protein U0441_34230 [Polyangiaceae bacterium]